VLLQSRPEADEPQADDLYRVGTSGAVLRYLTTPDGNHHVVVRGLRRFRVVEFLDGWPFAAARVQHVDDAGEGRAEIEGRGRALKARALEILQLLPQVPPEVVMAVQGIEGAAPLADFIAGLIDIPNEDKQSLLETFDLEVRLDRLLQILAHRLEVLKVSREVDERTRESIGDVNRKQLLREQMRTIQKELGEDDDSAGELAELEKAIADAHASAVKKLPTPVLTRLLLEAVQHQAPKRAGAFRPKLRYAHQGGMNPPIVVIHGNSLEHVTEAYKRYLEGRFREHFKLVGTPLKVQMRSSRNPFTERGS